MHRPGFLLLLLLPVVSMGKPELGLASRTSIRSRAEFDQLARIYHGGRFAELPHLMFVVDRSRSVVHYVNSKTYDMHTDFVRAHYPAVELGPKFFQRNYLDKERQFVLGTVAFQPAIQRFTLEFWEGDQIPAELVASTYRLLQASFFAPLTFKPNSLRQEQLAEALPELPRVRQADLAPERDYEPFSTGEAVGVLRLVEGSATVEDIDRDVIVLFTEPPIRLGPVAGVITAQPSSPLSHVHMLARSWGVPDVRIRGADTRYAALLGKWVRLQAGDEEFQLVAADDETVRRHEAARSKRQTKLMPRADLKWTELTDLQDQQRDDAVRFGAKSANLGEVLHAKIRGTSVPPGFTIPFHHYVRFAEATGVNDRVQGLLRDEAFRGSSEVRRRRLEELRQDLQGRPLDPALARAILEKVHREYEGKGLFVRSSTNVEDLPGWSGAGLYTTVPNVKGDEAVLEAVKTVWASVWNFEAFEAREAMGIDHGKVAAAVLLQEGVDADSAGVLITTNPFDRKDREGVYINAKRGLGIRVVEGQKVPEQLLFTPRSGAVRVLSRSGDDTMLSFDERGGVKETKTVTGRAVLTDEVARRLATAALAVKKRFGNRDQDIEWAIAGGRVYILQSRPYVE